MAHRMEHSLQFMGALMSLDHGTASLVSTFTFQTLKVLSVMLFLLNLFYYLKFFQTPFKPHINPLMPVTARTKNSISLCCP